MTSRATDGPVRIGLIGLGSALAYHFERISLRRDMRLVAGCDCRAENGPTHPLFRELSTPMSNLLARTDLDYVLVAAPPNVVGELALRSLEAGENVVIDSPPCLTIREATDLMAASLRTGRALYILPTRRDGFDFRAARHTVVSGRLGRIEAARVVSWAKAVPPDLSDLNGGKGPGESVPGEGVFAFFAFHYVDQLLQLVGRWPKSVFARITSPPASDSTAAAFFIAIAFRGGGDGLIDVNLHTAGALQTGWMLAGTTGAYCQQRIHVIEPSGEVCDMPIAASEVPQGDLYADLFEPARSEKDRLRSIREAATVLQVLEAARHSSRTGQVVEIGEAIGQ